MAALDAPLGYAKVSGVTPWARMFCRSVQISLSCCEALSVVRLRPSTVLPPMSSPAAARPLTSDQDNLLLVPIVPLLM